MSRKLTVAICLMTIIIAFAIILGGYSANKLIRTNLFLAHSIDNLQQQVAQQQQTITTLQTTRDTTQQIIDQIQSTQAQQTQVINQWRLTQINHQEGWLIQEAQYLVKIANNNLELAHDVPTAIMALQAADRSLQNSPSPSAVTLRKAVAADINVLQAVPVVDVSGTYLRLINLNKKIDSLTLPSQMVASAPEKIAVETANGMRWQRGLQSAWRALQQIVVVRNNPPQSLPFILPEQRNYFFQNLHAQIANAMWAVLHQNDVVYKASLQQATEWIKQFFVEDSADMQLVLKELDALQGIQLQPAIPNISASLQAFNDYTAQINKTPGIAQ